jgi:hypothetical protein
MKLFGKKTPGTKGTGRKGAALDIAESVHGSSDGGEKNQKSEAPTVSEKSKQSTGFLKKSVNKIGNILHKKFGSTKTMNDESMSNERFLGEIYKLMVENQEDIKFERQESVEKKRSDDTDEENRHKEIIKALTLRRRPTRAPRRVKEEKKPEAKKKEPGKEPGKEPDKDKVRKESEAKAKKEAEEKAAREKAARDKADKEKADKEKANKEKANKERELQEKANKEKADKERELQEKTKRDQLEKERADAKTAKEEADRKAKEAATQAEKETAKREQEEARKKLEEAEKAKQKAAQEAAEREKQRAADAAQKKAAEEERKRAAEEAKRKAEEEAKRKAEEKLKKEAEEKAKKEAEEKLKKETAEKLKKEEQEKLKKEAEEKTRLEKLKEKKPEPPTASQQPPKPAPKPDVGTATQVITGAVAVTAALAGRQALATNISEHESGDKGYNAYNRGDYFLGKKDEGKYLQKNNIDLSKMSISDYLKRTNKKLKAGGKLDASDPNVLFAVGKYQIVPKTMKGLVEALKLDPDKTFLTQTTQDMLFARGLTKSSRPIVDAYINGKEGVTRDSAILALAQEFASVGVPYDMVRVIPKYTDAKGKEHPEQRINLKKGETFYKKEGGFNNAKNLPDAVGAALDADRLYTKVNAKPKNITSSNSGTQTEQASTTNNTLKGDLNKSNNKDSNSSVGFFGNLFGGGSDTSPTVNDAPIHTRGNK